MRYLLILLISIVLLFSSGCTGPVEKTNIGGVDIGFLLNQPPRELREDANFMVGLELINNLPKAVEGTLCLSDTPANSFGGIQEPECRAIFMAPAEVSGNSKYVEESRFYFPETGSYYYHNLEMGIDTTTITAELEYSLESVIRGEICLKRDPAQEIADCRSNDVLTKGNKITSDFAPVTIDRLETSIVPEGGQNRLYLEIDITKIPYGEIISETGESILMMDIELAGTPSVFECYPLRNGGIRMVEDRKTVKCDSFISLGAQEFYMDSLIIKLNYDYSISASTGAIALKRKTGDR